jgi:hypothetical protein
VDKTIGGGIDNRDGVTIEATRTIRRSPADPKRRDWERGRTEAITGETIELLTTHETRTPNENGPA